MSTTLYIKCMSHNKPIGSSELCRKDTSNLALMRKLILDRDRLVAVYSAASELMSFNAWTTETYTIDFLIEHPECEIGLFDAYGDRYSLTTESYDADWFETVKPQKLIHISEYIEGIAVPKCFGGMMLRRIDMAHEATCQNCIDEAKRLGLYTP